MKRFIWVFAALVLVTCQARKEGEEGGVVDSEASRAEEQEGETRRLRSGKELVITRDRLDNARLEFTYLTDFQIPEEHEALQREVEEVWNEFLREEVEKEPGITVVYISPRDDPGVQPEGVYEISFRLERNEAGEWKKLGGFAFPSPK
jgi:hypothetical protein